MNKSIDAGTPPPVPGLENEEPELAHEDDIPSEDRGVARGTESERPRDVERE